MTQTSDTLAIFGHPGHELRLLHALETMRADCLFLTDGSAGEGRSRTPLSRQLLNRLGLTIAPGFSPVPDKALYDALRTGETAVFRDLVRAIAAVLAERRPARLITDSAEGYNPVHDLCHFAVLAAARQAGLEAEIWEVALNYDPADFAHARPDDCLVLDMDDAALAAKLDRIRAYAADAGPGLSQEADELLARDGVAAQAREILRPALDRDEYDAAFAGCAPFFEQHGLRRVREGKYREALTLQRHLRPALDAMEAPACAS